MMQRLTITNFIKIPFLDVAPKVPVLLFAGRNEVGKTSVAESVRFALRGENPRIRLKSDRQQLLTNGAKKGTVELHFDNNVVKRNIRDGKVTGDSQFLPDDELIADICLQAVRFATLDDNKRRGLTMRLADVDLSVDRVAEKMLEKGGSEEQVRKYRPLLMGGIKDAHAHAKRRLSEARGAWKEVTGETYGSQKAETWKPEATAAVDADEIHKSLAEIDTDLAKLESERDQKLADLRLSYENRTAALTSKIAEYEQLLRKPEPLACPHCGGALLMVAGKLEEFTEQSVQKDRIQSLLTGARLKRQGEADAINQEKTKVNADHDKQLAPLRENRQELQSQIQLLEQSAGKENRAKELHEEIKEMGWLAEMLDEGPDGVAAALVKDALRPLNERLQEIGQGIGWLPAVIHGDMNIARGDGCPYGLLSESAQWRIDVMLHILVSELTEFAWLIFDRMDLLDVENRNKFIKWIAAYGQERTDEATILVMGTLKQKPNLDAIAGIEVHWME